MEFERIKFPVPVNFLFLREDYSENYILSIYLLRATYGPGTVKPRTIHLAR